MNAQQKIDQITRALQVLARELRSIGDLKVAKIAQDAAADLPDSSKLKLYEILKEDRR